MKITWDPKTENPADISGYASCNILINKNIVRIVSQPTIMYPLDQVKDYSSFIIKELKQYYQDLNESNLMIEPIREFNNGNGKFEYSIHYNQYYNNIKLENSGLGYNILSNGEMLYMGSSYKSNINLDTNPKISLDDAIKIAKIYVNFNDSLNNTLNNIRKSINANLTILPIEKNESYDYKLCWKIRLYTIKPLMDKTLFINADNGSIIKVINNFIDDFRIYGNINFQSWDHHETDPLKKVDLQNDKIIIKDRDPFDSYESIKEEPLGKDSYDITIKDDCNSNFDYLSCADPTIFYLLGDYIQVFDQDNEIKLECPDNLQGNCNRDLISTEGANCYYHGNIVHDFYKNTFGYEFPYNPMPCHINMGYSYNGIANGKEIFFGKDGMLNWVRESDVIYHEYTHNVIDDIYQGCIDQCSGNSEGAAMNEGIPDYFAQTITGDPDHGIYPADRNLSINWNYIKDYDHSLSADNHENGKIISSTLWDMRYNLGKDLTDKLVFNALFKPSIDKKPINFSGLFYQILVQDDDNSNLGDGTPHLKQICDAFKKHGMTSSFCSCICNSPTPKCTSSGQCVQCITNSDCSSNKICINNQCTCQSSCSGKQCGDDGCGGSCGTCDSGFNCNSNGQCIYSGCSSSCSGKQCGSDSCSGYCGSNNGLCPSGYTCDSNGKCINNFAEKTQWVFASNSILNVGTISSGSISNLNYDDSKSWILTEKCTLGYCDGLNLDVKFDVSAIKNIKNITTYARHYTEDSGSYFRYKDKNGNYVNFGKMPNSYKYENYNLCSSKDTCSSYSSSVNINYISPSGAGKTDNFYLDQLVLNVKNDECSPICSGKNCGSDGCGSSCGICSGSKRCNLDGKCVDCLSNSDCNSGYYCSSGICQCIPQTCTDLGKKCGTWTDRCGKTISCGSCDYGYSCDNGKCSCPKECTAGNMQCNGNSLQTCEGYGNGACARWTSFSDCGSNYCEDFSAPYCKNGNSYHSRICYNRGCLSNNCYSNSYIDEQIISTCSSSQNCYNGACCSSKSCSELGKECGNNIDNCGKAIDCGNCSNSGNQCKQKTCNTNGICETQVINEGKICGCSTGALSSYSFLASLNQFFHFSFFMDSFGLNSICKCNSGNCGIFCTDDCNAAGILRCNGNNIQTCKDYNSNGCLEWGNDTACLIKPNAITDCILGICNYTCNSGFSDCNNNLSDGCEINIFSNDLNNCGNCGNKCAIKPNTLSNCNNGICSYNCNLGFSDCNNNMSDGCEANLSRDINNCGACSNKCTAGQTCQNGKCACVPSCNGKNCGSDGCGDNNNCGTCAAKPNAQASCSSSGSCIYNCISGFSDCNNNMNDGCEVNLNSNSSNCGSCNNKCTTSNSCAFPYCDNGNCKTFSANEGLSCNCPVALGSFSALYSIFQIYPINYFMSILGIKNSVSICKCFSGNCQIFCSDICNLSDTRCGIDGKVQTCSDFNSDGCLEWGNDSLCNSGQKCLEGKCMQISRIFNNANITLKGNLTIKMQKKDSSNNWNDLKMIFFGNITIPAKGFLNIDNGTNNLGNQIYPGFNNLNVKAPAYAGAFRIYIRLDYYGKYIETNKEFSAGGNG